MHPLLDPLPRALDGPLQRVRAALTEIAAGRPVVVVHGDGPDAEGDLVFASQAATAALVAFTVRHTSGFLCVAVTAEDADRLDLPPMVRAGQDRYRTAYAVSVDARDGVGTGISASDRARTIALLASPDTVPDDLTRPGHVVPLRAHAGGVLSRPGRAEAAADLAVLAGLRPSGALCEIVSVREPGEMARGPELWAFARDHDLQQISIADLVAYRLQVERIVERAAEAALPLASGRFTAVAYHSRLDGREHVAFVRGDVADDPNVPVHVHRECLLGDVFGSMRCGCGEALRASLVSVGRERRGVVLYLRHDPRRPLLAHVTGTRWRDPAWGGSGASGTALDGPALDGPALDGPALDGPALDGPALDDAAFDEITVHDAAVARQILDDLGVGAAPMVPPDGAVWSVTRGCSAGAGQPAASAG